MLDDSCTNCELRHQPATRWCLSCQKSYCDLCSNKIHEIIAFRDHRTTSIDDRPPPITYCAEHEDEKVKYWCHDDSSLLCSDCILFEHKNHHYARITDVVKQKTTQVLFIIHSSNIQLVFYSSWTTKSMIVTLASKFSKTKHQLSYRQLQK